MTIQVGDKIPSATLMQVTGEGPNKVDAAEFFAGKRVALFSVPGAFTPTCSAKHLPGYVEKAADLKAKGIDAITMLADGNAELAEGLGLTMDGSGFGLGKRGQRFSMVVNDGVVEQLNVEAPGDFNVSSADYMLGQL